MAGIPGKANSQVADMMDTGLQKTNVGFNAKSVAPKSASPLHNRGLTVGGKMRTGGGGRVSPKVVAAIKLSQSAPKGPAPHPAVAKNTGSSPSIKWG